MPAATEIPLPLLVTGVAGVAGYNAFHYFRHRYGEQVIGVRRVDNWPLNHEGIVGCNLHDRDAVFELFQTYGFRSVLNTEGSCALRACEFDPMLAWRINVLGLATLLGAIESIGHPVRTIHLSIDLVFSGTRGGRHVESDATDPVTVYGKTMVQTEQLVLAETSDACVLRISLPMGVSFNGHAGAIDWIQSRFKKQKPATLYYDEIRTPTYTDCMNPLYEDLLTHPIHGLYHAGGPTALSLYEIAQVINRVGGYNPDCLMGCYRREAGPVPPRAGNVSMTSSRIADALGYEPFDPWPLDPQWIPKDRRWHYDRKGPEGSAELLASLLYENPARRGADTRPRAGETKR